MEGSQITTTGNQQALEIAVRYLFSSTLVKVKHDDNSPPNTEMC